MFTSHKTARERHPDLETRKAVIGFSEITFSLSSSAFLISLLPGRSERKVHEVEESNGDNIVCRSSQAAHKELASIPYCVLPETQLVVCVCVCVFQFILFLSTSLNKNSLCRVNGLLSNWDNSPYEEYLPCPSSFQQSPPLPRNFSQKGNIIHSNPYQNQSS